MEAIKQSCQLLAPTSLTEALPSTSDTSSLEERTERVAHNLLTNLAALPGPSEPSESEESDSDCSTPDFRVITLDRPLVRSEEVPLLLQYFNSMLKAHKMVFKRGSKNLTGLVDLLDRPIKECIIQDIIEAIPKDRFELRRLHTLLDICDAHESFYEEIGEEPPRNIYELKEAIENRINSAFAPYDYPEMLLIDFFNSVEPLTKDSLQRTTDALSECFKAFFLLESNEAHVIREVLLITCFEGAKKLYQYHAQKRLPYSSIYSFVNKYPDLSSKDLISKLIEKLSSLTTENHRDKRVKT